MPTMSVNQAGQRMAPPQNVHLGGAGFRPQMPQQPQMQQQQMQPPRPQRPAQNVAPRPAPQPAQPQRPTPNGRPPPTLVTPPATGSNGGGDPGKRQRDDPPGGRGPAVKQKTPGGASPVKAASGVMPAKAASGVVPPGQGRAMCNAPAWKTQQAKQVDAAPAASSSPPLPPDWIELPIYYNTVSGNLSWNRPRLVVMAGDQEI